MILCKKRFCLLLAVFLSFSLFGCRKAPDSTGPSDPAVAFPPADMELCSLSSRNTMAETENGYYMVQSNVLYYADKAHLDHWTAVCGNPSCKHLNVNCSAEVFTSFSLTDGKILSLRDIPGERCEGLYSMEPDGSNLHLVHKIERSDMSNGGLKVFRMRGSDAYMGYSTMQTNGLFRNQVIRIRNGQETVLCTNETERMADITMLMSIQDLLGIRGDFALINSLLSPQEALFDRYYRPTDDGCEEISGLTPLDKDMLRGGYLDGNILRYFVTDDGYYQMDLTSGETQKLRDSQLPNSRTFHLSRQYVVESNVHSTPDAPQMLLFDGNTWKPLQLPDTLRLGEEGAAFYPTAISTEHIFFEGRQGSEVTVYAVSLTDPDLQIFSCGDFTPPPAY